MIPSPFQPPRSSTPHAFVDLGYKGPDLRPLYDDEGYSAFSRGPLVPLLVPMKSVLDTLREYV